MSARHMAWTVKQLIDYLQQCDSTAVIVLSKDAGGNGYSPLSGADTTFYHPETTYSGDVTENTHDVPCVALWPVN